tara:strand:+ start:2158 stop:2739 length:582 start_codon:yes stop_codon:yes gene_type:complete
LYDSDTAALIRSTPQLPNLDREGLPDALSRAFSEIVSARISLREGGEDAARSVENTIEFARRLARTNEALVAISPERDDRAAAGFVAATAYQLAYQATTLADDEPVRAHLTHEAVSSDVASMLLFLVAGASADASEVAGNIVLPVGEGLQRQLVLHLVQLAQGKVGEIADRVRPKQDYMVTGSDGERDMRKSW